MPTLRARVLSPTGPDAVRWLDDAIVRWDDAGRITAVEPYTDQPYDDDVRPGILTPGFVDTHIHCPQMRIVGAASGPLLTWLEHDAFPEETRFADRAHATRIANAFCTTLAAAGTTTSLVYGTAHPDAAHRLFEAADATGLRMIAGPVLMDTDCPEALQHPTDVILPALDALRERWHGHDGRLELAVIPRFGLSCTDELLAASGAHAAQYDLRISTHISENHGEIEATLARFGTPDYLAVYEQFGLITAGTVLAHCIHFSDSEWERFVDAGCIIAHCPDSNDFLGSGGMPTAKAMQMGASITLATDIAGGRSFRMTRAASSAYDNALRQGLRLPPETCLWWATRGSATALNMDHIGALEPGLDADMVLHDVPEWVESADKALAWLMFHADGPWPRRTWVRGKTVWDRTALDAGGGGYPWWSTQLQR